MNNNKLQTGGVKKKVKNHSLMTLILTTKIILF